MKKLLASMFLFFILLYVAFNFESCRGNKKALEYSNGMLEQCRKDYLDLLDKCFERNVNDRGDCSY